MNATVTSIKHNDVYGKEQLYLKIEVTGKPDVLINIGEKTFNKVNNLFELKETLEVKKGGKK